MHGQKVGSSPDPTPTVPVRAGELPFHDLKTQYAALKQNIDTRIRRVLEHGQYILGPEVAELEAALQEFTGAKHCITVASGTEALIISLMALEIGPGDEVITTPFTFAATAEAISLVGATPVYVDIEADTCNIDARRIREKVGPKTRAILPVSLYGQPADMDEICAIASASNISVIEDAAQSFGAQYRGRRSTRLSTIGCTSFFPSKPLGCYGDGGALFTDDDGLAKAMREIRVHGQERRYYHTRIGVGGRMDTLQCAIVLAKLERFEWEVQRRQEIGGMYSSLLRQKVPVVAQRADRTSVFAQYTVFVEGRAAVQARLKEFGIPTAVHYPLPLNEQPAYRAGAVHATPVAKRAAEQVLSLPMGPDLSATDVQRVATALVEAVG